MQTIAQPLTTIIQPLNTNWTFTESFDDETALLMFEQQFIAIKKLSQLERSHLKQLQTELQRLFIVKSENYWYAQARLNALATRLPKATSGIATISFPIDLQQLDDAALAITEDTPFFQCGKAAREWMKHWIVQQGYNVFNDEAALQQVLALAIDAYERFWTQFQQATDKQLWQQMMQKHLGFEISDEPIVDAFYYVYKQKTNWRSLTSYQQALVKAAIPWAHLTTIPVAQHPFTQLILRKHEIEIK